MLETAVIIHITDNSSPIWKRKNGFEKLKQGQTGSLIWTLTLRPWNIITDYKRMKLTSYFCSFVLCFQNVAGQEGNKVALSFVYIAEIS